MKIIILGATGSGKGTQSKFISKLLKLKHIETGAIFRKEAKKNKFIRKLLDEGELVPDKIVINIFKNEIKNKENFILDGFPRTLVQARALKFNPDLVLLLDVNKNSIIKRLISRKREDDTKKNIEERYKMYLKKTLPVIDYYKKKKMLIKINGNFSIKQVNKNIEKILAKYQQQP
ncbi:MAG: nucleoside monophosphate kinase [Nanoarchaeota archaeon]